jgi:signal transduction histidine kinase
VARDDRDVAEPGVSRDRFLSEFALALVEGVELQEFLDWSVAQIGRILGVDRFTLFLFDAGARTADLALAVRSSWAADGIEAVPAAWSVPESLVSAHLAKFEALVAEDVFQEPALAESEAALRLLGTKSLLAVPIGIDGALLGFVAASTVRERRVWTPDDVAFVESAVHHLSAAFKQTELVEELGRERDRLSVLFDLASAVQRSTTVNDVVETALSGLRDTLLFPIGVFSLIVPEGDALIGLGGYGDAEPGGFSGRIPLTPERPTVPFRVLESGQPLIVNDVEEEPEGPSKDRFRQLGARSFGVFPMRSAGKTIGVMSVASRDASRRIEFDDVETLQSLADFVGVALEQRRSADAVAEAMREARSLADASHALLTRTADRRVLLDQILDALALHFGHEACSLLLVDQERRVLVPIGRRGLWWSPVDPVSVIPLDAPGLIPLAARTGRVVNAPNVGSEPDYVAGWADARSELVVPLILDDRVVGVFDLQSGRENAFSIADARTIRAFAERAALALRLSELVGTLERSNRLKDDFLANLSHEIRTPLTGIVGWAEVLLDSHRDDAEARRALEAILGQADTLSRMLADLIDLSCIDNFGLELRRERVAVPEILAAALDAVSPGARRKGVAIRCALDPDLPPLEGDAVRLKQVLWNLLTNGVKFSRSGGTVHVIGRRVPGGGLEIAVEDEGHGIEPEFLPLVFDRFRQEETSSNRRFGGLGIGLSIARAIVLAHGGTIVAESEGRERGSRFRITFPAERVVTHPEGARRDRHEAAR